MKNKNTYIVKYYCYTSEYVQANSANEAAEIIFKDSGHFMPKKGIDKVLKVVDKHNFLCLKIKNKWIDAVL